MFAGRMAVEDEMQIEFGGVSVADAIMDAAFDRAKSRRQGGRVRFSVLHPALLIDA